MRLAGTLQDERLAERFVDHLATLGIDAEVQTDAPGQWQIWAYDEASLERVQSELETFLEQPDAERYQHDPRTREPEAQGPDPNFIPLRQRWLGTRSAGARPVTYFLIAISLAASLASSFGKDFNSIVSWLMMSELMVGLREIRAGQLWRVVTPIFVHFGVIHLLFNMLWLHDLGGMIEDRRGSLRLAALVLAAATFSNLLQYALAGPAFGGMSGVVYALFGYIWLKGRYEPGSQLALHGNTAAWLLVYLVVCFTGALGPVANWAHLGGLIVGCLVGARRYLGQQFLGR